MASVLLGMNSYKFVAEFYTILLEEQLQVSSEITGCGNLFLTLVSKTDTNVSMVLKFFIVLARDDAKAHLHAFRI
jgi:hypothetical protein